MLSNRCISEVVGTKSNLSQFHLFPFLKNTIPTCTCPNHSVAFAKMTSGSSQLVWSGRECVLCMCACPLVYAHTGKHRVVNIDGYMVYMYMYKCRCSYCTCIYLSTWEGKGNFPPISKRPQWLNSVPTCTCMSWSHICAGDIAEVGSSRFIHVYQ